MRKTKSVSVSLSLALLDQIDEVCRQEFWGRSEAIEELISCALLDRKIKSFPEPDEPYVIGGPDDPEHNG